MHVSSANFAKYFATVFLKNFSRRLPLSLFTRNCLHLLKIYLIENFSFLCSKICIMFKDSEIKKAKKCSPVDTGRKLNVHKMFRRRPGRLLKVLCMFNLRPVPTGSGNIKKFHGKTPATKSVF